MPELPASPDPSTLPRSFSVRRGDSRIRPHSSTRRDDELRRARVPGEPCGQCLLQPWIGRGGRVGLMLKDSRSTARHSRIGQGRRCRRSAQSRLPVAVTFPCSRRPSFPWWSPSANMRPCLPRRSARAGLAFSHRMATARASSGCSPALRKRLLPRRRGGTNRRSGCFLQVRREIRRVSFTAMAAAPMAASSCVRSSVQTSKRWCSIPRRCSYLFARQRFLGPLTSAHRRLIESWPEPEQIVDQAARHRPNVLFSVRPFTAGCSLSAPSAWLR